MISSVVPAKIIVMWFAIICFVLAALLLFWPDVFVSINRLSKKWFSTAKFERELNRTRDIDTQLMRFRHVLGIIALVLAFIFSLFFLKYN